MQTGNENPQVVEDVAQAADNTKQSEKKKSVGREILSWIVTLGAAVVIALLIRTFLFEPIRVDGGSMSDTLLDGEIMFVTKPEYLLGEPQRGDVIICKYPDMTEPEKNRPENFVKRLIGVPGDTIEIVRNVVYVNGEAQEEVYLTSERNDNGFSMAKVELGEGEYFVMGDNRDNSHDCRNYFYDGSVMKLRRDQIVGHVRCVLFPFNRIRGVE